MPRFVFEDEEEIFSLIEEANSYRLKIDSPEIREEHVEEFMDKTVEWLSTNPEKGILIDFKRVKMVCSGFTISLSRYYTDIKNRGLNVRLVNVNPKLEPYIDVSNITVVMSLPEKPVLSARELLRDISDNLTDHDLKKKYGLSSKGLASMFRKLLMKGLITRRDLAHRMGIETREITVCLNGIGVAKVTIDAAKVLKEISEGSTDADLMRRYRLSPKGLSSLLEKLYKRGLLTKADLSKRKTSGEFWCDN